MADEIGYIFTDMRDAENVPIEDLRNEVARLKGLADFYETKQLAIKKFINSVYGALGSKYFIAYNTEMAESITAQGRELNHYSENSVNDYFEGIFQSNPKIVLFYQWVHYDNDGERMTFKEREKVSLDDYYSVGKWEECKAWEPAVKKGKKLTPELKGCLQNNSEGRCDWFQTQTTLFQKLQVDPAIASSFEIDKGRTTQLNKLTGKLYDYLTNKDCVSMTIAGDTDSVAGNTKVDISSADIKERMDIADLFTKAKYLNDDHVLSVSNGSEVIPGNGILIRAYDKDLDMAVYKPMKYVMRHKVSKARFRIKTESGKEVIVSGDHSCIVLRNGELIDIKAKDINKDTDKIITINNTKK